MPTYVYHCDACEAQFEQFQSFKDAPLTDCPHCQRAASVRRIFQPVGIVFKGSGWYITDSRKTQSASTGSNGENTKESSPDSSSKSENGSSKDDTSAKSDTPSSSASSTTSTTA